MDFFRRIFGWFDRAVQSVPYHGNNFRTVPHSEQVAARAVAAPPAIITIRPPAAPAPLKPIEATKDQPIMTNKDQQQAALAGSSGLHIDPLGLRGRGFVGHSSLLGR